MRKQYHVLNGDSLKQNFPKEIEGEIIVARECLVDGDVEGNDLDELFASRAKFLSQNYGGTELEYYEKSVPEFQKIASIDHDSDINLWFEDDLFCQVNFWFVAHLINKRTLNSSTYLVRPEVHNQYGFGGLSQSELISVYKKRTILNDLDKIGGLWELFQKENSESLLNHAQELESSYPFILPAVEAHLERKPTNESVGRPTQVLIDIMKELDTEEFEPVFREFSKRETIYGFGDLQVKRLLDDMKNNL